MNDAAYVAGLFDGEGHVEEKTNRIVMTNTDEEIVRAYSGALFRLGISHRLRARRDKPNGHRRGIEVIVGKKAARAKFAALIPVQASVKKRRIELISQ